MSGALPSSGQMDALKLQLLINDIEQKRADYLRKEQERRFEPLKIGISAFTAGAALMGAAVGLSAFLMRH